MAARDPILKLHSPPGAAALATGRRGSITIGPRTFLVVFWTEEDWNSIPDSRRPVAGRLEPSGYFVVLDAEDA